MFSRFQDDLNNLEEKLVTKIVIRMIHLPTGRISEENVNLDQHLNDGWVVEHEEFKFLEHVSQILHIARLTRIGISKNEEKKR